MYEYEKVVCDNKDRIIYIKRNDGYEEIVKYDDENKSKKTSINFYSDDDYKLDIFENTISDE